MTKPITRRAVFDQVQETLGIIQDNNVDPKALVMLSTAYVGFDPEILQKFTQCDKDTVDWVLRRMRETKMIENGALSVNWLKDGMQFYQADYLVLLGITVIA